MPGADREFVDAIATGIRHLRLGGWQLRVRLPDAYRSGMIANFVFSALAVIVGAPSLPGWAYATGSGFSP